MSIARDLGTWLQDTLTAATAAKDGAGAWWCHDCEERKPAGEVDGDDPSCPRCGGSMEFEREPPSYDCC